MFFKQNYFYLVCVAAFSFSLTSCDWKMGQSLSIGERNPPKGEVHIDMSRFSCLREIKKHIVSFVDGKMTASEITGVSLCLRTALTRFQYLTKDSSDGSYSPKSLTDFLNNEYLKEQKISQTFAHELMMAKTVLLGGSAARITRMELKQLNELILFFEKEAKANLPYIHVYRYKFIDGAENLAIDQLTLTSAKNQFRNSMLKLAEILNSRKTHYPLKNMLGILNQLRLFLRWDESYPDFIDSAKLVSLVDAFNEMVNGRESSVIAASDWPKMADVISNVYGVYLNYRVRIEKQTLSTGPGLDAIISSVKEIFSILDQVIADQPDKVLKFEVSDKLILALYNADLLPKGIRATSLIGVYRYLIERGFQKLELLNTGLKVRGLGTLELSEVRSEFALWADTQRYIGETVKRASGIELTPSDRILEPMRIFMNKFDFSSKHGDAFLQKDTRSAEVEAIINNMPPLFQDGDARAFIMPNDERSKYELNYGLYNMTRLNVIRALVRILVRGFAEDKGRIQSMAGVTEEEMVKFYMIAQPLGIDLKLMDIRSAGGGKYFIEGNVFTTRGNGVSHLSPDELKLQQNEPHNLLTFYETVELLSILLSGVTVQKEFYDYAVIRCQAEGNISLPRDPEGSVKLTRECYYESLFERNLNEISNLPNMHRYLSQINSKRKQGVLNDLEVISQIDCEDHNYIEKSQFGTFATVFHYIESIYSVYDKNKDSILDENEIYTAFPRFHGYLAKMIRESRQDEFDVDTLKAVFFFLLKKKRLPAGSFWEPGDLVLIKLWEWWYFDKSVPALNKSYESAPMTLKSAIKALPILLYNEAMEVFNDRGYPDVKLTRAELIKVLRVIKDESQKNKSPEICKIKKINMM